MELYSGAAEPLAKPERARFGSFMNAEVEESRCPVSARAGRDEDEEKMQARDKDVYYRDGCPWLDRGEDLNPEEEDVHVPDHPDVDLSTMLTRAAASSCTVGLPVRYLPHSTLAVLYLLFIASWDTLKKFDPRGESDLQVMPSSTSFQRRWHAVWNKYLKIRKSSEHAMCNTCFRLQAVLNGTRETLEARRDAARMLREHLQKQYLDRQLYWSLRFAAQSYSDILVIIVDSMDKAKFAWPAWPFDRRPHDLDGVSRPRMSFTAVLAHGYCAGIFMAAETLNHGADHCLEVLCRTINYVYNICEVWKTFPATPRCAERQHGAATLRNHIFMIVRSNPHR